MTVPSITLIGGPTALIEIGGFRFLTDPTFEPGEYNLPQVKLIKTSAPALASSDVGPLDAILLSHDQHADNLDRAGREFLSKAPVVFTTIAGARRLGGNAVGLAPWQAAILHKADGISLEIVGTPARHGPAGIEPLAGEVTGFLLTLGRETSPPIYITGDTVWYDGVAEVARRFKAGIVMVFAGSAQSRGPFHLTMDTNDAIETAKAFPDAVIVPVHHDGWAHFKQSGADLEAAFTALGFGDRLRMLPPGVATPVDRPR